MLDFDAEPVEWAVLIGIVAAVVAASYFLDRRAARIEGEGDAGRP